MHIDETSLTPIFMQVAQWLEEEILKDHICEEEQVPSTNQFAAMYQINPATARKGFGLLVDEGILYKKRGIGMFVSPGAKEKIKMRAKERFINEALAELLKQAKSLGMSRKDVIDILMEDMNEDESD